MALPSIPYPPARPEAGFWAPVTSTINWCEEDYYATIYSAEIVNSFTNLVFIYLGIKGALNCWRYGHDTVFLVAFIGYLLVASGSFAFHSTLKYPMQLVDELNMLYTTSLMFYATFSLFKSRTYQILLGLGLVVLNVGITLYYHYLQNPVFHQSAFALLVLIVMSRACYVMEVNIRPSFRKHATIQPKSVDSKTQEQANDRRDTAIVNEMWQLVGWGLGVFLGGFAIWNLDNQFCSTFRHWRHQVGLPWGLLLEGHGWWHIMTGIGSYDLLVWAVWLRICLYQEQDKYTLNWPSLWALPEVIPISESKAAIVQKANGYRNGHAKSEDRKSV